MCLDALVVLFREKSLRGVSRRGGFVARSESSPFVAMPSPLLHGRCDTSDTTRCYCTRRCLGYVLSTILEYDSN